MLPSKKLIEFWIRGWLANMREPNETEQHLFVWTIASFDVLASKLGYLRPAGELEEGLAPGQAPGGARSWRRTFLPHAALYTTAGVGFVLLDAVWMLLIAPRLGLNYFDVSGAVPCCLCNSQKGPFRCKASCSVPSSRFVCFGVTAFLTLFSMTVLGVMINLEGAEKCVGFNVLLLEDSVEATFLEFQ